MCCSVENDINAETCRAEYQSFSGRQRGKSIMLIPLVVMGKSGVTNSVITDLFIHSYTHNKVLLYCD